MDESLVTVTPDIVISGQHKNRLVNCFAITPDGSAMISGNDDKVMLMHDSRSGEFIGSLTHVSDYGILKRFGHDSDLYKCAWIKCIAFSPDGTRMVSCASNGGAASLWNMNTLQVIGGYRFGITASFSPDGKTVAVGSADGELTIHDVNTFELIGSIIKVSDGHCITCISTSPDGSKMAICTNKRVHIYDAKTLVETNVLTGYLDWISNAMWSNDSTKLLTCVHCMVKIWDGTNCVTIDTSRKCNNFHYLNAVLCAVYSPNNKTFAMCRCDGSISIYDSTISDEEKHKPIRTFVAHTSDEHRGSFVNKIGYTPDGARLVSCANDHTIKVWSVKELI